METDTLFQLDAEDPSLLQGTSGNGVFNDSRELQTNILIVDDRADKLLALEAILEALHQNIVLAHSGKEALRLLLKQDFAVILLDVSMPGMDGFETAALIRKRLNSEHTPIIFVTSIGNTENQVTRGYSLGAVDYILTPIVPEVLRTKVSVFVDLHRKTALVQQQAEQLRRIELAQHRQELAEARDRLDAETRRNRFFTLAVDMLGIADSSGRWLQTNPAWERILGFTAEEITGRLISELVHPEEREQFWQILGRPRADAAPVFYEGRCPHKDGSCRWLRWSLVPFPSEELIYVFARDITPRKQAEEQIRRLNRELEQRVEALTEANRELEAFNYSIAHDLRTPLRGMSGFAQALLEEEAGGLGPQGLEYAQRIARSAQYMDTLLQDLLTYSRLTRTEMAPTPICLEEPVNELLHLLEKDIRNCSAEVRVKSPLGSVLAHSPTVKQILSNLIGNALKFVAPGNSPVLNLYTTRHDSFVRLWVEDNGIGIASPHQEKIFGLFTRLHDSETYAGTGIGLALVRKGAERMGGRAGVESELGRGSRFWVDFPAAERTNHE